MITDLQPDAGSFPVGAVSFRATIGGTRVDPGPPSSDVPCTGADIEWGGEIPQIISIDSGLDWSELRARFPNPGIFIVEAKAPGDFRSAQITIFRMELEVAAPRELVIEPGTAVTGPRMPGAIEARVILDDGTGPQVFPAQMAGRITFWSTDCPPGGPKSTYKGHNEPLLLGPLAGGGVTPDFDRVIGGSLMIEASATVGGAAESTFKTLTIKGKNPRRTEVRKLIDHVLKNENAPEFAQVLKKIACHESGQAQFCTKADGGVGYCPCFGRSGDIGVMQLHKLTSIEQAWNWKKNVEEAIRLFMEKVITARNFPKKVRASRGFRDLVKDFNTRRAAGSPAKPPLKVVLPNFTAEQLVLDSIRGYNGWNGRDPIAGGVLHEFRVQTKKVGGDRVLDVRKIDEQAAKGEATWERIPRLDRPADPPGSRGYVDAILKNKPSCPGVKGCRAPCPGYRPGR